MSAGHLAGNLCWVFLLSLESKTEWLLTSLLEAGPSKLGLWKTHKVSSLKLPILFCLCLRLGILTYWTSGEKKKKE